MPHRYGNSRAILDHHITDHLSETTLPPLLQPIKAGTRFNDPRGMKGDLNSAADVS